MISVYSCQLPSTEIVENQSKLLVSTLSPLDIGQSARSLRQHFPSGNPSELATFVALQLLDPCWRCLRNRVCAIFALRGRTLRVGPPATDPATQEETNPSTWRAFCWGAVSEWPTCVLPRRRGIGKRSFHGQSPKTTTRWAMPSRL